MFQYISCYSLSEYGNLKKLQKSCFNTSHVTLYRVKTQLRADHPRSFNTSHVTLYLNVKQFIEKRKRVSIHLMLLFILLLQPVQNCQARFQYISCYSLSKPKLLSSSTKQRFNTSHVTLYRISIYRDCQGTSFQYISCYSLSNYRNPFIRDSFVSIHLMLLFIERSVSMQRYTKTVSIHLMLLFIRNRFPDIVVYGSFQYISCYSLSGIRFFYEHLDNQFQYISCYSLSGAKGGYKLTEFEFQYISCYSLSVLDENVAVWKSVSIHLMLLFIGQYKCNGCTKKNVSIHLMLLFIEQQTGISFTNSSVSIHLMLLFIFYQSNRRETERQVSIHLMLLFIESAYFAAWNSTAFQYISCYSLSMPEMKKEWSTALFQYISCYSLSLVL